MWVYKAPSAPPRERAAWEPSLTDLWGHVIHSPFLVGGEGRCGPFMGPSSATPLKKKAETWRTREGGRDDEKKQHTKWESKTE